MFHPRYALPGVLLAALVAGEAAAHFQELIPTTEIVAAPEQRTLGLELRFTHPMAGGPAMEMGPPVAFGVLGPQGREELLPLLHPTEVDGRRGYRADYTVRRPGDHTFYLEPAPYWEPAEGKMIVHYTKVVVGAFDGEENWDTPVGFPVEIQPLSRPYGLWRGNLFRGIVTRGGEPVPFAEVEVEWRNDGSLKPPAGPFLTQVVKADAAGVFAYAIPRAGWWGFAALLEGAAPLRSPQGEAVPVEAGALIWVRAREME